MRLPPITPKPPARPAPLPEPPPEPAAVQDDTREPSEASAPAQAEPREACEHCRSFVDAGKTGGYCYRNPPALRVDGVSSAYPPVRREWWCNEFKQAPHNATTH